MTTKLSPQQSAIDRRIVDEVFETIPEDWKAFIVLVEPRTVDGGGEMITIVNPDVVGAMMEPSDTIRANVTELVAFLAQENRKWDRITYAASMEDSGAWKLKITTPLPADAS